MVQLITATREPLRFGLDTIAEDIMYGVSPRASIDLYRASKAKAFLENSDFVSPSHIASVLPAILRHRLILSYDARARGVNVADIISHIIAAIAIP